MTTTNLLRAEDPMVDDPIPRIVEWYFDNLVSPDVIAHASLHPGAMNPYHGLRHTSLMTQYAVAAAVFEGASEDIIRQAIIAGLYHDYGHTGLPDSEAPNIEHAVAGLYASPAFLDNESGEKETLRAIERAIRCTEYKNGEFPLAPVTLLEQCLRDADLCMIYSPQGREVCLQLAEELGFRRARRGETVTFYAPSMSEPRKLLLLDVRDSKSCAQYLARFFALNVSFLKSARMYTEFGKRMKAQHLTSSLVAFRDLVVDRILQLGSPALDATQCNIIKLWINSIDIVY